MNRLNVSTLMAMVRKGLSREEFERIKSDLIAPGTTVNTFVQVLRDSQEAFWDGDVLRTRLRGNATVVMHPVGNSMTPPSAAASA